jgi:hypothetical protein
MCHVFVDNVALDREQRWESSLLVRPFQCIHEIRVALKPATPVSEQLLIILSTYITVLQSAAWAGIPCYIAASQHVLRPMFSSVRSDRHIAGRYNA